MINFTPKKHQKYQKPKVQNVRSIIPSKLSIAFIMGYAAAVRVYNTNSIGHTNILLN